MENVLDSLNNICDTIEKSSADSASNTNDISHCCINKNTGKMNCVRNAFIVGGALAGTGGVAISNTVAGRCARCSTGENGDPAMCSSYTGGYCD